MIKISTRQNLILKNLEEFLNYGFNDIHTQFESQLEESMIESANIISELENKIISLEDKLINIQPNYFKDQVADKKDKKKLKN